MDISEQCGYTFEQQCNLFQSIAPLFANKQLVVVINKMDEQPWDTLESERKKMIEDLVKESGSNTTMLTMSNVSEEGVSAVKNTACDKLLASRVDSRVSGNKVDSVMNRLQVVYPTARDGITREACIPDSVLREREMTKTKTRKSRIGYAPTVEDDDTPSESEDEVMDSAAATESGRKKTARELMWENGGPGVWAPDYREQYDLADPEWRFDAIPQILDGKNIADYVDPDIEAKLLLLEEEEQQLQAEYDAANMESMDDDASLNEMEKAAVTEIRDRIKITRKYKERPGGNNRPVLPREVRGRAKDKHDIDAKLDGNAIEKRMEKYGVDASKMVERGRKREREGPRERRRKESAAADREMEHGDEEMTDISGLSKGAAKRAKKERDQSVKREKSLARSHSRPREPSQMGLKDENMAKVAKKVESQGQMRWHGGKGEGDHTKSVHLVKWMNTGKKRNGTHYCR